VNIILAIICKLLFAYTLSCAIVLGPVLELQIGPVLVLVLEGLVLVLFLFLGLECVVLGLVLGLEGKVLVNITWWRYSLAECYQVIYFCSGWEINRVPVGYFLPS